MSRKYEARDCGTVSGGVGDPGGVSYGSYQFASKNGSAQAFVNSLKTTHPEYYKALAGKKPGSPEFSKAWKELAAKDPKGFDKAQHDYIKATHYEPAVKDLQKKTGLDVTKRSKALQDVIWSTAVQHGPENDIVKTALKGRDPSKMSDEEIIKAIYAERGRKDAKGTLVHFSKASPEVQKGVAKRFVNEQKDALAMLAAEKAAPKPPPPPSTTKTQDLAHDAMAKALEAASAAALSILK